MKSKIVLQGLAFMIPILVCMTQISSCKKETPPETPPVGNGLAPGECRIKAIDDTAFFMYNSKNIITKLATYSYTYTDTSVVLKDELVEKSIIIFKLAANGLPLNQGTYGLTDTIAQELTWFTYNPDSTLKQSSTYTWIKDKYVFQKKSVYTWTNKNLTRWMGYGKDTTTAVIVANLAYDLTKKDPRKANFEKMYTYSPVYSDILPKCASVNLATDLQWFPTGQSSLFLKVNYAYDSKNNITRESLMDPTNAEVYFTKYFYECN